MEKLKITNFGTVRGMRSEMTVNDFIEWIKKRINEKTYAMDGLYYSLEITKDYDNKDKYLISYDNKQAEIDLSSSKLQYPILKHELDNFCAISDKNSNESLISQVMEKSSFESINNVDDINTGINYLKNKKKFFSKQRWNIFELPILSVIYGIGGYKVVSMGSPLSFPVVLTWAIASTVGLLKIGAHIEDVAEGKGYSLLDYSKILKKTNHKIKVLEKKLELNRTKDNSHIKTIVQPSDDKKDVFLDSIIRYMKRIDDLSISLPTSERKRVLEEINVILKKYKTIPTNNYDASGLTLGNDKQKALRETIDKLNSLYLEVEQKLRNQNQNKVSIDECEKYENEINQNLENLKNEEEGQSRVLRR